MVYECCAGLCTAAKLERACRSSHNSIEVGLSKISACDTYCGNLRRFLFASQRRTSFARCGPSACSANLIQQLASSAPHDTISFICPTNHLSATLIWDDLVNNPFWPVLESSRAVDVSTRHLSSEMKRKGVYYWLHEEGVAVKFDCLAHHHVLYSKLGDKLLHDI